MSELVFEAKLDRNSIPADHPATELQCHLKLWSSAELEASETQAVNTNICLVFDCSSSMWGEKLHTAIESAKLIVDNIHESHTISLVAFQSKTKLLVDNAQATESDKEKIKTQIDEITDLVGGFTDTAAGIRTGMKAMTESPAAAKIMLLMTDGDADSPSEAEQAAIEATKAGIQMYAVGIGSDYDAEHMLKLVKPSSGTVFGEKEVEKIKGTFAKLVGRIGNLVAANARINMTFQDRVQPKRAYKTSPEQAFLGELAAGETAIKVGNIERGKVYGFLVALEAPPHPAGELLIARATLTYDLPSANLFGHTNEVSIRVRFVSTDTAEEKKHSDLWETAQRARLTELSERFVDAYNRSDQPKALRYMEVMVQDSEQLGDHALHGQYSRMLKDLRQNRGIGRERLNSLVVSSLQAAPAKPTPKPAPTPEPPPPQIEPPKPKLEPPQPKPEPPKPKPAPPPPKPEPPKPKPAPPPPKPEPPKPKPAPPPPKPEPPKPKPAPPPPRPVQPKPKPVQPKPKPKPKPAPKPIPKQAPVVRRYDVLLQDPGDNVILLIRVMRDALKLSLHDVGEMVNRPGCVIGKGMSLNSANQLKDRLEQQGAQIEVRECTVRNKPTDPSAS